jgi:hypothetical protein
MSNLKSTKRGGRDDVLDEAHEEVFRTSFDLIFWEVPPPLQIAKRGVERVKNGWKWSCKVGECKETYVVNWIITAHLKKLHEFIIENGNPMHLSTREKGPQLQNHFVTNAHILSDA